VSDEQRENLDVILRRSALPVDGDVEVQRRLLRELLSAQPLPGDVTVTAGAITGSLRSTRFRRRLTTRLWLIGRCWIMVWLLGRSCSRESPRAVAWRSRRWSALAITGCRCQPRRS